MPLSENPKGRKTSLLSRLFSRSMTTLPDVSDRFQKAVAFHEQGKLEEAEKLYREIIKIEPEHSSSCYLLGVIAHQQGKDIDALELIKKAVAMNPDKPDFHCGCGEIYFALEDYDSAVSCFTKAIELKPDFLNAYFKLGNTYRMQDKVIQASNCHKKVIELKPDMFQSHFELGELMFEQGSNEEAIRYFKNAIDIKADYAEAHANLGFIYAHIGQLSDALECYEKSIQFNADNAVAHNNLGNLYKDRCEHNQAITHYEKALMIRPDYADAHSNLLLCMNYLTDISQAEIFNAHKQWQEQQASGLTGNIPPYTNKLSTDRRLRIGYISPDFRDHSVARFLEPVLVYHDKVKFEIYGYSNVKKGDRTTSRLRQLTDHWRDISSAGTEEAVALVRNDNIDILVDLAGHTADNSMPVLACKPAPVQVTYLGYPATTGLSSIDYRLTDATADPPGLTDDFYTERLIRLPHGFLCYQPSAENLTINGLPSQKTGFVTFACFNNQAKINDNLIKLWQRILAGFPDARLLLKSHQLSDAGIRTSVLKRLEDKGITTGRVELVGWLESFSQHMDIYNKTDIALDTYPYNGTTTTCEALWMGIPVITLAGKTHHSRVGASLLTSAGIPEFIAETPDDYVNKALTLARDTEKLAGIRTTLRAQLSKSPLTDAGQFTIDLENAYIQMWKSYCEAVTAV